jgi:hypothetical protein
MLNGMTDNRLMFHTLMRAFVGEIPRAAWGDIRRLAALAWAVVGLCLSKAVSLAGWGEVVESRALLASSRTRYFQRWLDNPRVRVQPLYEPLVRVALGHWETVGRVFLALDTSVLKGSPFVLIRVSLIYRGRAIPLAWRVIRHASATVGYAAYQPVLDAAYSILPAGLEVVLLADRGFVHRQLFRWLQRHHWHYRIRLTDDTLVHLPDHQLLPVRALLPPRGAAHFYHQVCILGHRIGPVHLALAQLDEPNQDPWYIVSDEPTDLTTFDEFGLRFDIEENFLDDKSNGFQVESSRQRSEAALERLFLVLAVATLHCTSVGVGVVRRKLRRWVDTHWDRGMSYLKIGWSWLRQQSRRGWSVMPPFCLDPDPDPEPAMASRRQAARAGPTFAVEFKC